MSARYKVEHIDTKGVWHKSHRGYFTSYSAALAKRDEVGAFGRVMADYFGNGAWEEVPARMETVEESLRGNTASYIRRLNDRRAAIAAAEPEPVRQRQEDAAKLRAFQAGFGRLGGNCMDRDWNAWSAGWDAARAAIAAATGEEQT